MHALIAVRHAMKVAVVLTHFADLLEAQTDTANLRQVRSPPTMIAMEKWPSFWSTIRVASLLKLNAVRFPLRVGNGGVTGPLNRT